MFKRKLYGLVIFILVILLIGGIIAFKQFGNLCLKKSLTKKAQPVSEQSFSCYDMVLVPEGLFWMGSNEGEEDEIPVHNVWLDAYWIDRCLVTNTQYNEFVKVTGHRKPAYWDDQKCNLPDQQVVGVDWYDAVAYCEWRSEKEGFKFRLPTEAEWEKSSRGNDARIYPWGNQAPDAKRANVELTERVPEVGKYKAGVSPYGCYDMVGSVWQWCLDWYDKDYYKKSPLRNPQGPDIRGKRGRIVRGGNWVFLGCCSGSVAYALRASRREAFHEKTTKKSIGFRCVRKIGKKGE